MATSRWLFNNDKVVFQFGEETIFELLERWYVFLKSLKLVDYIQIKYKESMYVTIYPHNIKLM